MSMNIDDFCNIYPNIYHMAEAKSWQNIQRFGLLSTEALLDLFKIPNPQRERLLSMHRPEMVSIEHPTYGVAWIRDQKPMSDSGLAKALPDDITPSDWYRILNRKTFFWATWERLQRLIGAAAYRNRNHIVITVDTKSLLECHLHNITLSPYNSGCTKPNPFKRGHDCFLPLDKYPFEDWRTKRSQKNAVVEIVAEYSVPDIFRHTLKVDLMQGPTVVRNIYTS